MAEATEDHLPRAEAWAAFDAHARVILEGVEDPIAAMATMSCLIHHGLGLLWSGFYRVVGPGLLRVGPYQGTLGCLEITFDRGVCGAAATRRRSMLVPDVRAFPGHITYDSRSASELVVPVFARGGPLLAVLDLDADFVDAFSSEDVAGAERLVAWFNKIPAPDLNR